MTASPFRLARDRIIKDYTDHTTTDTTEYINNFYKDYEEQILDRVLGKTKQKQLVVSGSGKGSTLDQRFQVLEASLRHMVEQEMVNLRFKMAQQVDFHVGYLNDLVAELRELVADIRMEWDEFQEDER